VVVLVVAAALVSAACSTSATSSATSSAPAIAPVAASRMLTAADLGPGWAPVGPTAAALPCNAPPTAAALVGAGGSVVRLADGGGLPSVVEYAAHTISPLSAYVTAIDVLQSSASCGTDGPAHARSSKFLGVLPLPSVGRRSVCMVIADTADGVTSQSGYEVVRLGTGLVVVGMTDAGALDTAELAHVTAVALQKLGG
jgi:hypothetical protein